MSEDFTFSIPCYDAAATHGVSPMILCYEFDSRIFFINWYPSFVRRDAVSNPALLLYKSLPDMVTQPGFTP
ncbi:hypothetical protein ACTZGB_07690 [Yersinia bercovieri]|uniref:hypothetical protein n=1 Tax=Yersinia bercovieri TaxID=634 RepID=UPI00117BFB98|nr:hypothetical protein [Yersinia bercovieri]MDN0101944.1 hypothetical protein [Yersinia bercovieri]QKJ08286.1 hypothetical protein HRK25_16230 [Yersinia bercovieri ATCC 43970]